MTSFQTGFVTEKNSSRVLRPPGGGSSDIFGTIATPGAATRTDRMKSNIFGDDDAVDNDTPRRRSCRGVGGQQTHTFGESDALEQPRAAKEDTQGNLFGEETALQAKESNDDQKEEDKDEKKDEKTDEEAEKTAVCETAADSVVVTSGHRGSFNPITGDSLNSTDKTAVADAAAHPSTRVRQPPGGASSGLW